MRMCSRIYGRFVRRFVRRFVLQDSMPSRVLRRTGVGLTGEWTTC